MVDGEEIHWNGISTTIAVAEKVMIEGVASRLRLYSKTVDKISKEL